MIRFFYETIVEQKKNNMPYWKLLYKINKVLVNILFPIFFRWRNNVGVDAESNIVVSMTTYPARIRTVWIVIESLFQQTVKPYKVVLYLAKEQFPNNNIPVKLKKMQKRGLTIKFVDDLKSHKKYFYAIQEYRDYCIVTADDDILYPENHLEKLWNEHINFPNTIICCWSHRIEFNTQNGFEPYNMWVDNSKEIPSFATLAVGCNGILYPPNSLPPMAFDKEVIISDVLYTDDLWLKCMEILNGFKCVNCNRNVLIYFTVFSTKKSGLWKKNTGTSRNNDVIWNRLIKLYPEVKEKLIQENINE